MTDKTNTDEYELTEDEATAIDALAAKALEEYNRGETTSLRDYFDAVFPRIEGSLRYLAREDDGNDVSGR